jgi:membrane protein YqaA with SNARE-associated domain
MVDSGTFIIAVSTLAGGVVGFVVGAFLTDWLSKRREGRENERNVTALRKLLYEDITTIYVELREVLTVIENERITSKFEEYYNAIIGLQKTDWYKNARKQPVIFMQFSPAERRAMAKIAGLQETVVGVSRNKYLRKQVEEGEDRVEALRKDLKEKIIDYMREQIKRGLDEELLLEVCSVEEDESHIRSIFDEEREAAGDEQENEKKPKKKRLLKRIRL